ncbi:unnamed protein product [Mytilus coruscus]|uniref:Apple domain-containing protein n=1 Tax=Mytilus coruscus TaxID=42192 RepID=A0A6J8EM17_MYTCO|nr:unnamed protein product [Mytilus coruscus]
MEQDYLPLVLANKDSSMISLTYVWTIHKVNNETSKGNISYENVPYTIEYNLDDLESVLCVYFVYEDFKFSGWEADDCKNEAVMHHALCENDVNVIIDIAVSELTFYDEKVVWTEAKKYCEYTNTTLIGKNTALYLITTFEVSLKLNSTSLMSLWRDLPKYPNGSSSVVSDKPVSEFGVGRLSSYEFGFELILLPMFDKFEFSESYTDRTNPIHAFMCEKQTEIIPFVENDNSMIVNKVPLKNISASSTVECEEQCITLITYGIHCAGFNYNWTLQECSLLGNLEDCIILTCHNFIFSKTEGMSAFLVRPYKITMGEYKPIHEPGSTDLRIQDNDNTDPMVTDQQVSIFGKTATTTKPTSTIGGNDEGRLLTIIMGFICAVSCVILIYKAVPILHQVKNMKLLLADGKITRTEVEEQIYDAFTIEMSDEDGERILTERVITLNIPPNCHMDIII